MPNDWGAAEIASILKNTPIVPMNRITAVSMEGMCVFLRSCVGVVNFNKALSPYICVNLRRAVRVRKMPIIKQFISCFYAICGTPRSSVERTPMTVSFSNIIHAP